MAAAPNQSNNPSVKKPHGRIWKRKIKVELMDFFFGKRAALMTHCG
jgi:hypothetical protein